MFDSMYDARGREWQTKAFGRSLHSWRIGDTIESEVPSFQAKVLGSMEGQSGFTLATVRDSTLVQLPAPRDPSLPLIDYGGGLLDTGQPAVFWEEW